MNLTITSIFETLPSYRDKAYRSDTGFIQEKNTTALDVVKFEENELENVVGFEHLTQDMRKELSRRSAEDIVWVSNKKSVAKRYGIVDLVYDLGDNPKIIAIDGDGGFLVLKDNFKHHAKSR